MKSEALAILLIFIGFIVLEIIFTRFFAKPQQTKDDAIVEVAGTLMLTLVTQPLVLLGGFTLASLVAPGSQDMLTSWHFLSVFGLFLIFDDMSQYWWHRISHMVPWLYKLHRPHHNANYLSIRVVYRNNIFYYLLMPGLWFSGVLIYLGGAWVYAVYLVIKMTVIFGAHSDVRWDAKLYKIRWLSPVMWVVERTISTPSTHSAHHGKHLSDGVTHYKGNFGNLLFFWDVLFGTAKITRRYPDAIGVENLPETTAAEQLIWPLVNITPMPVVTPDAGSNI
ncbi:MAG: sterol desaturase/sphingolipid hydroxylase (fatty acid hydroxylase superfamily) [Arenicella sp.]|jgi:sterol desaturase/sphingolipid hydroxylase (fatty acid hydroxylase superfamily)